MKTKTILCALVAVLATGVCLARPGGGFHHVSRPSFHHFGSPRFHRPPPPPPHRYHHHHHGGGFVSGFVGGFVGGAIVSAIAEPAPVVVQETVVQQPVVVQQPAVPQPQTVWVEGRYVDQVQANGSTVRIWQSGHYEQR